MSLFVRRILTKIFIYCSPCSLFLVVLFGDSPLCLGQVVASSVDLMFNLFVSVDLVDLFDTRVDAILYGLNFNSF